MGRRGIGGVLALTLSALKASAAPRNDHCFLDKVNETVLTTRDLLDWPLDPLRPWWTRVVDARLDPKKCERGPAQTRRDDLSCALDEARGKPASCGTSSAGHIPSLYTPRV